MPSPTTTEQHPRPDRAVEAGAAMFVGAVGVATAAAVLLRPVAGAALVPWLPALPGAAAIACAAAGWRMLRQRTRGLAAVQAALRGSGGESPCWTALELDAGYGETAERWNDILRRLAAAEEAALDRRAEAAVGGGREGRLAAGACRAMPQGVLVVDHEGAVAYANPAVRGLLGLSPSDAPEGRALRELIDDEELLNAAKSAASRSGRASASLELQRGEPGSGGTRAVLRVGVRRVPKTEPPMAVIVAEDITQQRTAQEAREVFVSQAAHELRTPLTNIRLYAEGLLEEGALEAAERERAANVITSESRRLERIVNDMLSVSEMDSGSYVLRQDEIRTDQLFQSLEEEFAAQAKDRGITLAFDLPPKMPVIPGERDKLVLALHNLIGNALKYTPAGGTVTITVDAQPSHFSVAVADTGIGIPEADLNRVFERFFRVNDERVAAVTGTGLGLALAREVVRLHGGDIMAESEPGVGSTFTLTIPLLASRAAA